MAAMQILEDVLCRSTAPLETLHGAPPGGPADAYVRKVWFKSEPLDRSTIYRLAQLQLVTKSRDQGRILESSQNPGSWSWFEVAIYADKDATSPRLRHNGKPCQWKSHQNAFALKSTAAHYGLVFDRRGRLLDALEPGDIIVVHACARFPDWENHADSGYIDVKLLKEELFSPQSWTLKSKARPDEEISVDFGIYTISAVTECYVKATDDKPESKIWFTTPILDKGTIDGMEEIQLWTTARYDDGGSSTNNVRFSGNFDLVILDSPESTTPKVKNGISMVWSSHDVHDQKDTLHQGLGFERGSDLMGALEVNDVVGVRASVQFRDHELNAKDGRIVIRIANKREKPQTQFPDSNSVVATMELFEQQKAAFFTAKAADQAITPPPPFVESLQAGELRADDAKGRPLQLLCLDGGGVRGVASLRILKTIMAQVSKTTGQKDIKPCDYFDMIGGTSTGGLIAIMLGRLKMTIEECERAYHEMSKRIFGNRLHSTAEGLFEGRSMYDAKGVESAVKDLLSQRGLDPDLAMKAEKESDCKVFLMATRADAIPTVEGQAFLRTYHQSNQRTNDYEHWKIWQAARATSAAPLYFDRMVVDNQEFIDGGILCNNPVWELLTEARLTFRAARPIGCILSLGTGMPTGIRLPEAKLSAAEGFLQGIIAAATGCERAHQEVKVMAPGFPLSEDEGKYWRFNVKTSQLPEKGPVQKTEDAIKDWFKGIIGKPVDQILPIDLLLTLDDYKNMDRFVEWTDMWLQGQAGDVAKCAMRLHSIVGENSK
ncbi:hypothetical protein FRB94_006350 [Tulasnella sp. JGI-2019a]|nr:hypothetical protein FRB94_006350 [Tulasnella sp. JGI-2019a]